MAENIELHPNDSALSPASSRVLEWTLPLLLGLAAGVAAGLFVAVHWTIAVAGGFVVLGLSLAENERFLLLMIFLVPVGWTLGPDAPVRDVATAARFITVAGFFLGRWWRGELNVNWLWRPRITRVTFLFAAAALGSIVLGTVGLTHDSVHSFYRFLSYAAFYLFLVVWVDSKRRMKRIVRVLLASMIFIALYGMIQVFAGGYTSLWLYLNPPGPGFSPWRGRMTSLLNYPNSLAGYLNLILPLALGCSILPSGRVLQGSGRVALVVGCLALLLTQSIGALAAFMCVAVLAGLWLLNGFAKRSLWIGSVIGVGVAYYAGRAFLNSSHSMWAVTYDVGTRLLLWTTAWHFFLHSPVLGIGWGNFAGAYGPYLNLSWIQSGVYEAHNIYLQLLSETGIVGFASFFALIFFALRESRYQMHSTSDPFELALAFGCFGGLLTVLVHGFIDFLFEVSPPFGTMFWTLLAFLVISARLRMRSKVREGLTNPGKAPERGVR